MPTIQQLSKCVRSKNAGPFWVTIEIFCDNREHYDLLKRSPVVSAATVAELYHVPENQVKVFYMDNIMIIKFSYPRPFPSGYRYENDMHSGQQYVLLAERNV